jgi:hypothetical protein
LRHPVSRDFGPFKLVLGIPGQLCRLVRAFAPFGNVAVSNRGSFFPCCIRAFSEF